jgi:6-pyruvoyltetrahydropterin/6-carboxytetrahydropterin synthase
MITLTRRYRFSASHRLHVPALAEARNAELFGKCNNPFGHGHDYLLSITVAGEVDEQTGLIVRTGDLDQLVDSQVIRLLAHRNLNTDVPQFAELVPTTENLALVIADLLEIAWPAGWPATLERVHVQETDRNGFEVVLSARRPLLVRQQENVAVHA